VFVRWAIRIGMTLAGVAVGVVLSSVFLTGFHVDATSIIVTILIFWLVNLLVQLLALRVLVRQPSVALAGLLAIASTVVSLFIVNVLVSGLHISGISTYLFATLIIWGATAISDAIGRRMIRNRRAERRDR
jgi:hypothetical protein